MEWKRNRNVGEIADSEIDTGLAKLSRQTRWTLSAVNMNTGRMNGKKRLSEAVAAENFRRTNEEAHVSSEKQW